MSKDQDTEYREHLVTEVSREKGGWSIKSGDGWSFYVDDKYGVDPTPGMTARFYGKGIGYDVRGLDLDGRECFYRTAEQEAARHQQWCDEQKAKRLAKFECNREKLDAEYAALPVEFQRRLDRFRAGNLEFRPEFESYEMMCCQDAVRIADAMRGRIRIELSAGEIRDAFEAFAKLSWDGQKALVPDLSDGHSGNSFGMACRLAFLYLVSPTLVEKEHGALTPLVGCEAYGCTH